MAEIKERKRKQLSRLLRYFHEIVFFSFKEVPKNRIRHHIICPPYKSPMDLVEPSCDELFYHSLENRSNHPIILNKPYIWHTLIELRRRRPPCIWKLVPLAATLVCLSTGRPVTIFSGATHLRTDKLFDKFPCLSINHRETTRSKSLPSSSFAIEPKSELLKNGHRERLICIILFWEVQRHFLPLSLSPSLRQQ